MTEFKVHFSVSPWLLLLIVPLLAMILIVYFNTKKRFRRSRNRVLSVILHTLVSVLCVLILSGIYFTYEYPNVQNELVILVDASFSSSNYKDKVNSFVRDVLLSNEGRSNVSIVTFGYDQKLVVPMGKHNPERAYRDFVSSPAPDVTATDIASALTYIWDPVSDVSGGGGEAVIHYPETAKILLISDGLETDRNALSVVKRIAMDGIQVDSTFYPAQFTDDVWITGVEYPVRNYSVGETVDFEIKLKSSFQGQIDVEFSDRDEAEKEQTERQSFSLEIGAQSIPFPYAFSSSGHHELQFSISGEGDSLIQNNVSYLSFDLQESVSVLILEKYDGESNKLLETLRGSMDPEYVKITVANISNKNGDVPQNIETLSRFDEVILVNIANADMPKEFVDLLDTYVRVYGGGLFTVGGFERNESGGVVMEETASGKKLPKPHSYVEEDMKDTKFQEMLPVEITDYTPPVALAIIIDRSSSMDADNGNGSALDIAVQGAIDALEALSSRDQVGVLTLQDNYELGLAMTPMTQRQYIINTIRRVASGGGGGTSYAPAIDMAGATLCTLQNAQKKHILLLSDGQPSDGFKEYNSKMKHYYDAFGITITVISIGTEINADLNALATNSGGHAYCMNAGDIKTLSDKLKIDLGQSEEISGAVEKDYHPQILSHTAVVSGINQSMLDKITMKGFFTSIAKSFGNVQVSLTAEYVPLYAQWECGAGKVGSFLCDLGGYWSDEFLGSEEGKNVLHNAVSNMISKVIVTGNDVFHAVLIEDNYRTQVSIYGFNGHEEKKQKLVAFVKNPEGGTEKFDLSELSVSGNRFTFENLKAGIYEVSIAKVPSNFDVFDQKIQSVGDISGGNLSGALFAYRAFSYSKEFDAGADAFETGRKLLIDMSTRKIEEGKEESEKLVYDAESLLSYFADVKVTFDPRLLFSILALVFMLLDIAARKFKFKWPHEIIKTRRQSKAQFGK